MSQEILMQTTILNCCCIIVVLHNIYFISSVNILQILSADHASLDNLVRVVSGLSSGDGSACLLDWKYFLSKHPVHSANVVVSQHHTVRQALP